MPQSPKTTGFMQTTPTVKSEMDAKQCPSANSTNNNNTIFNFPIVQSTSNGACTTTTSLSSAMSHEGKNLDVNDLSVNNVNVASSNHLSTSCCPNSSSMSSICNTSCTTTATNSNITNNINKNSHDGLQKSSHVTTKSHVNLTNTQSTSSSSSSFNNNNINVINVCDGSGNIESLNPRNGIIIAETHDTEGASYYDAIKLEENGTTAIIYETIVIENPATTVASNSQHHQDIFLTSSASSTSNFNTNNNNINECSKFVTNKSHIVLENNNKLTPAGASSGGIIVLTGSLNDLLLSSQNGAGQCLNDVVKGQIQSIVLNLNSQSSAPVHPVNNSMTTLSGQQHHQSIMVAINQQVILKKK
jgi:hypothetical protein